MTEPTSELYRELYEHAPCGYLTVDADGRVTSVNETPLDWTSSTREQLVSSSFTALLPPADQLFYETRVAPTLQLTGEVREVALTLATPGGTLPVLLNARLVTGASGAPEIRVAIFDATERQNYERDLLAARRGAEASESRVRTLQAASTAFGESLSEAQLADLLVEGTRDAMSATACAVVFVDSEGVTTHSAGVHPLTALAADPAVAPELRALREAGIVLIESIDEARRVYPGLVDGLIEARVEAFSIVPIGSRGGILGALMCFFGRSRTLSAEDVDLQVSLARQAAQVLTRIRLQDELRELALHDPLTGVANRRLLREHLVQGMAAASRHDRPLALIVLDLDGFKSINDERGHQEGDAALRWVASQVVASVRADDIVGRFGGDEFLVICHEADESVAVEVAERFRAAIAEYPKRLPDGRPLTASVGIAICEPEQAAARPENFFAVADAALYRSKREGKDRVTVDRVTSATS